MGLTMPLDMTDDGDDENEDDSYRPREFSCARLLRSSTLDDEDEYARGEEKPTLPMVIELEELFARLLLGYGFGRLPTVLLDSLLF